MSFILFISRYRIHYYTSFYQIDKERNKGEVFLHQVSLRFTVLICNFQEECTDRLWKDFLEVRIMSHYGLVGGTYMYIQCLESCLFFVPFMHNSRIWVLLCFLFIVWLTYSSREWWGVPGGWDRGQWAAYPPMPGSFPWSWLCASWCIHSHSPWQYLWSHPLNQVRWSCS